MSNLYRNWEVISEVKNFYVRMALSMAGMDDVERLVKGYPECFSDKQQSPIPFSVLLEWDEECCAETGYSKGLLVSHDILPGWIPRFDYDVVGKAENVEGGMRRWPEGVSSDVRCGDPVEMNGETFVVVERNESYGVVITLCPAACFTFDE